MTTTILTSDREVRILTGFGTRKPDMRFHNEMIAAEMMAAKC